MNDSSYIMNIFMSIVTSGIFITMLIGIYLIQAFAYYKLAEKAQLNSRWVAFIPCLQFVIVLHVIDKSAWNLLFLFIPIVNIGFVIYCLYKFMRSFGVEPILAVVTLLLSGMIPIIQSILILYVGYSSNFQYRIFNRFQKSY